MRHSNLIVCVYMLSCVLPAAAQNQPVEIKLTPEQQAAHQVGDTFIKAFNRHDAEALGQLWAEDAVYSSPAEGSQMSGRKEIIAAYAKMFQQDPNCKISARAQAATKLGEKAIGLSGILDEQHSDGTLTSSRFTAELRQNNGKWLIQRVEELGIPVPQPPYVNLKQLDWFLGVWEDTSDEYQILTTVKPSDGGNFVLREYVRNVNGKPVQRGTQRIGWDQEQQVFRAWLFDDDGTFGEGVLTQDSENQWSLRLAIKFPTGIQGSLTQIIRRQSAEKIEIHNVDVQLDGTPLPNTPIATLVKKADAAASSK